MVKFWGWEFFTVMTVIVLKFKLKLANGNIDYDIEPCPEKQNRL